MYHLRDVCTQSTFPCKEYEGTLQLCTVWHVSEAPPTLQRGTFNDGKTAALGQPSKAPQL